MSIPTRWRLTREATERYEQVLVPTILGPAARALVEWAAPRIGETVLDVGCGTGAATRLAAEGVGPSGRVVGVDANPAMIAVARAVPFRAGPQIEWHVMEAGTLGLAAGTVDLVLCAQTLQFVEDLVGAVREMRRVLRKGGRVALSVWCGLRENPYSEALVSAIARRIGEEPAAGFAAAFGLSDADEIRRLLWAAGFAMVEVTKREIEARLPELRRFVPAHVGATAMAASFHSASAEIRETVVSEMEERLASYATEAEVRVPFRTHLAMGRL